MNIWRKIGAVLATLWHSVLWYIVQVFHLAWLRICNACGIWNIPGDGYMGVIRRGWYLWKQSWQSYVGELCRKRQCVDLSVIWCLGLRYEIWGKFGKVAAEWLDYWCINLAWIWCLCGICFLIIWMDMYLQQKVVTEEVAHDFGGCTVG